jgi:hypothetical protein
MTVDPQFAQLRVHEAQLREAPNSAEHAPLH